MTRPHPLHDAMVDAAPGPEDLVRVVRVLEYVGPRSHVEHSLERRYVVGLRQVTSQLAVREAIVGTFPEVVARPYVPTLEPCPDCECSTFRSANDRDRHLLKCRGDIAPEPEGPPIPDGPESTCGACGARPGETHLDDCPNWLATIKRGH